MGFKGGLASVMPQTVVGFYFPAFLLEVANVIDTLVVSVIHSEHLPGATNQR